MPREFKKLSHSIYECKYHIVFCPKYRYRVLRDGLADYVKREIYTLCSHKDGVEVIEANAHKLTISIWCCRSRRSMRSPT